MPARELPDKKEIKEYYDKKYEDVMKSLDNLLQESEAEKEAYRIFMNGVEDELSGNAAAAIEKMNLVLKVLPDFSIAYHVKGLGYTGIGQYDKAIETFNRAIALGFNQADIFINRGAAQAHLGRHHLAIEDYNRAIEIDPLYHEAFLYRGDSFYRRGEYRKSIDDCRQTLNLYPDKEFAHILLAGNYRRLDLVSASIKHFKRAFYLGDKINKIAAFLWNEYHFPFLLQRRLTVVGKLAEKLGFMDAIRANQKECHDWNLALLFLQSKWEDAPQAYKSIEAIVNFYMGDSIQAFKIFDEDVDTQSPTLRDQYYFVASAIDFLEPHKDILNFAIRQTEEQKITKKEDYYYAGMLYQLDDQPGKALICFEQAGDFLPALYAQAGIFKGMGVSAASYIQLAACIKDVEKNNPYPLSASVPLIEVTEKTDSKSFCNAFDQLLYAFELQEEIHTMREYLPHVKSYHYTEFNRCLNISEEGMLWLEETATVVESQALWHALLTAFEQALAHTSMEELIKLYGLNEDTLNARRNIEANSNENPGVTLEASLAMKIFKFDLAPASYIYIIKHFCKTGKLAAGEGLMLYFYLRKTAQDRGDEAWRSHMDREMQESIGIFTDNNFAPPVARMFFALINRLMNGRPERVYNHYRDFADFKSKFFTEYLPWWGETICKEELDKRNFHFE
jgi:tetratricopeptide (TPR) repeat protein